MKRFFRNMWADFRNGENIEVYIAAVAAFAAGIVSFFIEWSGITAILLVSVSVLLILGIKNWHAVQDSPLAGSIPAALGRPVELFKADMSGHRDVMLIGVSLVRTVRTHFRDLDHALKAGRKIECLLVNPDDAVSVNLTGRREIITGDPEGNRMEILNTLRELGNLGKLNPSKSLDIRVIDFPIGTGGIAFDHQTPNARYYVEFYPYKTPETQPTLVVDRNQPQWFDHYAEEFDNLWKSGKPWSKTN